jgi:prophage antirepressor-like protein
MTKVSWQNHDNEVVNLSVDKGEVHLGKDVATALGYAKSRNALTAHVDDEDKKDALIQGPLVTEGQAPCDLIGEWP